MTEQIVTANRLADGAVVYLTSAGAWADDIEQGHVAKDAEEAEQLLAIAETAVEARLVVDPYAIKITFAEGRSDPLSAREFIRSRGPSVRPDLGKQAEAG